MEITRNAPPGRSRRPRWSGHAGRHLRLLVCALALAPWLLAVPVGRAAAEDAPLVLDVPFVSQDDGTPYAEANCGPASVAMLLRALGVDASVTDLRMAVNRIQGTVRYDTGSSLETLAALLQAEGLATTGLLAGRSAVRWTPEAVVREIRAAHPVIAEVRFRLLPGHADAHTDSDHYVVLIGIDGESVLYHDPALPTEQNAPRTMSLATLSAAMAVSGRPFGAIAPQAPAFPIVQPLPGPPAAPAPAPGVIPLALPPVDLQPWQAPEFATPARQPYLWGMAAALLLAAVAAGVAFARYRRSGPLGALVFLGPRGERLGQVDLLGHPHSVRWNAATCARQLSSLDLVALRVDRGPNVIGMTTVQLSLVGGDGHVFGRIMQDQDCVPMTLSGRQRVAYLAVPADSRDRSELKYPLARNAQWTPGGDQHLQPRRVA